MADNGTPTSPSVGNLIGMIPGLAVTAVGGVVMGVLPGKAKIAAVPVICYGLYMAFSGLAPSKSVEIGFFPSTPPSVNVGDALSLTTMVVNTGNVGIDYSFVLDIVNPDDEWFRTFSGTGTLNPFVNNEKDIKSDIESGWSGPEGAYVGTARVYDSSTNPPMLLAEKTGIVFTAGEVPPQKKVSITPWSPKSVVVGDAVSLSTKVTNIGTEAIAYNFVLDIDDSSGSWFRTWSGTGNLGVGQTVTIGSTVDSGWTGPEGTYSGHAKVYDSSTLELLGEYTGPIMAVSSTPPVARKIYGYVKDGSGNPISLASVSIDEYMVIGDVTDPNGYYELTGLPEVSQVVHVTATSILGISQKKQVAIPGPNESVRLDFALEAERVSVSIGGFDVDGEY